MNKVLGADGRVRTLEMTMAEWKRTSRDYKTILDGVRYALTLDTPQAGGGTVSVPVRIIPEARASNPRPRQRNPTDLTVSKEILAQLGGARFVLMTGARDFTGSARALTFRISHAARGINLVRIVLEASDTYTVMFAKYRAGRLTTIEEYDDVYADQLQALFTKATSLETSLGTMGRPRDSNPGHPRVNAETTRPRGPAYYVVHDSSATGKTLYVRRHYDHRGLLIEGSYRRASATKFSRAEALAFAKRYRQELGIRPRVEDDRGHIVR